MISRVCEKTVAVYRLSEKSDSRGDETLQVSFVLSANQSAKGQNSVVGNGRRFLRAYASVVVSVSACVIERAGVFAAEKNYPSLSFHCFHV